ncbi:Protein DETOXIFICATION 16 [Linum perenne]
MLVLLVISIPLSIIWANTANILIAVGQQQDIAEGAGTYATFMIPSIFAYAILQCQSSSSDAEHCVPHGALLCCGRASPPPLVLAPGVQLRPRSSWGRDFELDFELALVGVWTFLKLAIPSAFMVCLENVVVRDVGTSRLAFFLTRTRDICAFYIATVWMIAYGLSAAGSTRVSNELGACQPERARMAVWVVLGMAVTEGLLVGVILFSIRGVWGYAYSNDKPVIDYVAQMLPIVAIANFLDCSPVRSFSWNSFGNFGLYLGIICALVVQTISLSILTIRTNWAHEAKKASDRVHETMPIERLS